MTGPGATGRRPAAARLAGIGLLGAGVAVALYVAGRLHTPNYNFSLFGRVGLGAVMLKVLMAHIPFELPSEADVRLSVPVLLFTLAATTIAGVFFGCAPAWQASRVNPNEALKEGGRTGTGSGKHRLRRILVVAEFALALTLLAAAGLAMHSFWNVTRIDLGIRKDHVLTFYLSVSPERLTKADEINSYYRQLLEKIRAVPGVVDAAASTGTPLQGTFGGMPFSVFGKPVAGAGPDRALAVTPSTPSFDGPPRSVFAPK